MRDLRTWEELQSLAGVGTEGADLDFKETLDPKKPGFAVELRKDVAAFANTLGGHIIVGVSTELNGTRCKDFRGIERELGATLAQRFEEAAQQCCRPTPFMATLLLDRPGDPAGKVVLVVRVEASPIAPVGASVAQDDGGKLVDKAWVFPYRVGSQTQYLTPDQFGAFESMTSRRAAALLDAIPLNQRGAVDLFSQGRPINGSANQPVTLESVDARLNVATFRAPDPSFTRGPSAPGADLRPLLRLPLDAIVTVWPEVPGRWTVVVRGDVHLQSGRAGQEWIYDPRGIVG